MLPLVLAAPDGPSASSGESAAGTLHAARPIDEAWKILGPRNLGVVDTMSTPPTTISRLTLCSTPRGRTASSMIYGGFLAWVWRRK